MDYHAHEILDMMEGNAYSDETLLSAITEKFGIDATFHTCSIEGLSPEDIIAFLKNKNKFIDCEGGYTVNNARRCNH